ncbi:2-keto-4-pentenoate hydratase [Paraburkholderia bryophila]|jgi:2-keto-4-pentenoate hydratase|uniref:2-keto-4-pentenoate hydratase n=1 Tax=Paraburkholderia bryophila TaxID=420952 RepID=A0A329BIR6_9BURK|nr:2-keto-4-pentenoate hydratase [Paraburkholderia bryophila]RAS21852.1 2-keto-4-pentenoate hydratase [Paraburkholderia bryophila]
MTISLSQRLADARRNQTTLDALSPEHSPADADAAYAIQHEILDASGARIGGWKIGAKSDNGPIQGAPLPAVDMHPDGARLARAEFTPLGLELEVAFRFGRRFDASATPYSEAEVRAGIGSIGATIEIVSSRYATWPDIDKLAQLADLQNHGALIVGEFTPYREDFPFVAPSLRFSFDGHDVVQTAPANPAGDPRRLLTWLVNHATSRGVAVTPDMVITAGSYTGMFFPQNAGTASGRIEGLAPVSLTLY